MSTSQLLFPHDPHRNRYPSRLAMLWHSRQWLPNVDFARLKDPDAWDKMQRDPIIRMATQKRLHTVAAKDARFDATGSGDDDERAAQWMRWMFDHVRGFNQCKLQVAKAVFQGETWQLVEGKRKRLRFDENPEQDFWVPTNFRHIHNDRFRWIPLWRGPGGEEKDRPEPGFTPIRVLEMSPVQAWLEWERVTDTRWLIHPVYDDEEQRLGRGRGIQEAIYFYHYAKGILLREMLQLSEKLGQGVTIVEMDTARVGSVNLDNEDQRQNYLDAIEDMRARNVLVHDKLDSIRHEWPDTAAWKMFIEAMTYLDSAVTRLILGGDLPTGGGGEAGSLARAEVESDSEEVIVQFDRALLSECITDSLVKLIWDTNRAQRQAIGLGDAQMPHYVAIQEKREDPKEFAELLEKVLAAGIDVLKEEAYERLGIGMPGVGDEIIEGRAAGAAIDFGLLPGETPAGPQPPTPGEGVEGREEEETVAA